MTKPNTGSSGPLEERQGQAATPPLETGAVCQKCAIIEKESRGPVAAAEPIR